MSSLPNIDLEGLPSRIAELRESAFGSKLSLRAFGEKIGVSAPMVSDYEKGKSDPGIDVLQRISSATGKSIWWVLTGKEPGELTHLAQIGEGQIADLMMTLRHAASVYSICQSIHKKLEGLVREEGEKLELIGSFFETIEDRDRPQLLAAEDLAEYAESRSRASRGRI